MRRQQRQLGQAAQRGVPQEAPVDADGTTSSIKLNALSLTHRPRAHGSLRKQRGRAIVFLSPMILSADAMVEAA